MVPDLEGPDLQPMDTCTAAVVICGLRNGSSWPDICRGRGARCCGDGWGPKAAVWDDGEKRRRGDGKRGIVIWMEREEKLAGFFICMGRWDGSREDVPRDFASCFSPSF